jgi:nitroimidazol reductase NimA-like FMN-containing flavoprotein (pyridoxamine 5'-phosphate oxidase superfamily)
MAQSMSVEVREAFLAGLHVGLVSLEAPSGAPAVTPVWYAYAPGGEVRILTALNGPLTERLRHAARATLCAQDEIPPYRYVTVEGPLLGLEPAQRETDFRPLVERYLPHMWIEDYIRRNWPETAPAAGHMLMARLRPENWVTVDSWEDYALYFGMTAG